MRRGEERRGGFVDCGLRAYAHTGEHGERFDGQERARAADVYRARVRARRQPRLLTTERPRAGGSELRETAGDATREARGRKWMKEEECAGSRREVETWMGVLRAFVCDCVTVLC